MTNETDFQRHGYSFKQKEARDEEEKGRCDKTKTGKKTNNKARVTETKIVGGGKNTCEMKQIEEQSAA